MDGAIQFAPASGGATIAYSTIGRGPAVVLVPTPCELLSGSDWHPRGKRLAESLARRGWRAIRYDPRGMGHSSRRAGGMSLDDLTSDIEAVVNAAGVQRFALLGTSTAAAVAAAFAYRHAERVSHLVLCDPFVSGEAWAAESPVRRLLVSVMAVARDDWDVFVRTAAHALTNFLCTEEAHALARNFGEGTSAETFIAYDRTMRRVDLHEALPRIEAPALVIHNPSFPVGSMELSREVAALLPGDARLVVVDDGDDAEPASVDAFLRSVPALREAPAPRDDGHERLTPREEEVLRLIASGLTNREIAADLVLSERTVARHITNIYGKLGLRSKAEATAYALRAG